MSEPAGPGVGRILDRAVSASREQLYAALQAALAELVDAQHGRADRTLADSCAEIERRLDMGVTYGTEFLR